MYAKIINVMRTTLELKKPLSAKISQTVMVAIEELAKEDERSVSNMIERALKSSPIVKDKIAEIQQRQQGN